jgi:hypothetical protein
MIPSIRPLCLLGLLACKGETQQNTDSGTCEDCDTDDSASPEGWDGPTVIINEFMADNATTVATPGGEYVDWIELYNLTNETVDLTGWTITDDLDEPTLFTIESLVIVPGGFSLLWADGLKVPGHVAFKLGKDGEEIGLYDAQGNAHTRLVYDAQATDWSAARMPDGSANWKIIDDASPGTTNLGP